MSDTAIKICGLSTPDTLEAAIRARADHVGFNFFPPSPRYVSLPDAAALAARAEGRTRRVGVFVDADNATFTETLAAVRLDALQLHGRETPEQAAHLKARFGLPVWKALSITSAGDVARALAYHGAADFILFDAKTPKGTLPGGMGLSFDWSLVANWRGPIAWGVAGGLTALNVADAIKQTGTPLVDTSSGVESAPGVKDEQLIASFCRAVRSA